LFCQILSKGRGTPIVFLHGFLGTGKDWKSLADHLKGRTCLAYDLPGHGNTPWTEMDSNDLLSSALPPGKVDLVGYSLGGRLAMRFAFFHPTRIQSLTLLSAHYGLPTIEERENRLQSDRVWAQKILTSPFDEFLRDWYSQTTFSTLHDRNDLLQKLYSMRKPQKPKELVAAMLNYSLGRQECYRDHLKGLKRPWRALYGEHDLKVASLYKGWNEAHCIPGAGHSLHMEAPREVAKFL
jgi:2-succinyl-6-hydroxy-2,4-cyclohexadiene-1-carboxylate synthase